MLPASLRRFCEIQLYALVFALPYEYYFGRREQSLFTTLKLQTLFLAATWICTKLAEHYMSATVARQPRKTSLEGRMLLAMFTFAATQVLAAALAPEFRGNAAKAAAKSVLGVILALVAFDLVTRSESREPGVGGPAINSLVALSLSGTSMAVLGLGRLAGIPLLTHITAFFQTSQYYLGDHARFVSTMEYPNTAGSFLSASLCATLAIVLFRGAPGSSMLRWGWPAMAVIQGVGLAFTYSRGATGSTVIAILLAAWAASDLIHGLRVRTAVVLFLGLLLAGMTAAYFVRHEYGSNGPRRQNRVALYQSQTVDEIRSFLPTQACQETVTVHNNSACLWQRGQCGIGYRWHNLSSDSNSPSLIGAAFTNDVAPSQKVSLPVTLATPSHEGEYLLIWFIFHGSTELQEIEDSYSPGELCVIGGTGAVAATRLSGKARRYLDAIREERRNLRGTPQRPELWLAAFRMFKKRPLSGMGPDNFRLLKGNYMDVPKEDETILANSLYLELLSGSGVPGLAAFLWLMWELGRSVFGMTALPSCRASGFFGIAYLTGFLSHGLVDYFLKFTPTFLLFWLMLGMVCLGGGETVEKSREYRL